MEKFNNSNEAHHIHPKWLAEQAAHIENEYRDKANDLAQRALALDLPEDMVEIILNHAQGIVEEGVRVSDERIREHWTATHVGDEPEEGELD